MSTRIVGALFICACVLVGCGPSQAQLASSERCLDQCRLSYMTCMEAQTCVDLDGQVTACEGTCGDKQVECEKACAGK